VLQVFEVEKRVSVEPAFLGWPDSEQLQEDSGLGSNRSFCYLGQLDWDECRELIAWEANFLREMESADIEDVLNDDERGIEVLEMLRGLDPGIASAVFCLAASGSIPFSSCNGGVLGDKHHEHYPIISFYCRGHHVPLMLRAANASSVALEEQGDYVIAYTGDVREFIEFARALYAMRDEIDQANEIAGHHLPN